jgi:hypothetical protein
VFADFQAKAHLLHLKSLSGFLVLVLLLGALIVVLAPVDNLGDRRVGVRGNLYQIQPLFNGNSQRFLLGQNTELLAGFVDNTEL